MNQTLPKIPKRPVAMFASALLVGVYLSLATAVDSTTLTMVWLPTSIVLVGLLTRGLTVLLPAGVGIALAFWLLDQSVLRTGIAIAASLIAPLAAYAVIQHLRRKQRTASHLLQTIHIFIAIAIAQAPVAALILLVAYYLEPGQISGSATIFASHWVIETASGVIFVRSLMVWMPDDGSGFCPMAGMLRSKDRLPPALLIPASLIGLFGFGAIAAYGAGHDELARLANIPVFVVAATSCLLSSRRIAGAVLMLATLAIGVISTYGANVSTALLPFDRLVEVELLLLSGGLLLQLLNALVEERLAQQRRLRRKAFANEVTDLPNLRALTAYLASPTAISRVQSQGLLMAEISVAGLGRWADLAGRSSIMSVEREIGACLIENFGERMRYLIHIGTGRFIMILARDQESEQIIKVMNTCFGGHRFNIAGNPVRLHYSIGVVDVPAGTHELETMLASLSIAQQHAARNGDHYFRLTMDDEQVRAYRQDLAWVEKIRNMLATDSIRLYAQPIAPSVITPESSLHFEVLARMIDDDGTVLTPDKFLPAISLSGLQIEFDRAVIELALSYLGGHKALARATGLCAINVTGPTICDPRFPEFLINSMREHDVNPRKITIEVTESDAIADLDSALQNIEVLRSAQVQVAVDDFGTGQATFEYIRRIKPHILKIDGSFVRRYADDALDKEIVESIVRMARAMGARTVAEFVETEQLAEEMRSIGVDFLQGWAISKPMPIETIKSFCDTRRAEMMATKKTHFTPAENTAVLG